MRLITQRAISLEPDGKATREFLTLKKESREAAGKRAQEPKPPTSTEIQKRVRCMNMKDEESTKKMDEP